MVGAIAGCSETEDDPESTSPSNTDAPTETERKTETEAESETKTETETETPEPETETETETETPEPANLSVSNLSVEKSTVDASESVRVSVTVENSGEESGERTITLIVDRVESESRDIEVEGGQSTTIDFTVDTDRPKTYTVSIEELETTFEAVATEVGGVMDSDTTWTADEGPYSIVETVQVAEGTTLTIEPGVTIWGSEDLARGSMFLLHGEIIADGTPSEMITIDGGVRRPTVFDAENSTPKAFLEAKYCLIRNTGAFWMRGHGGFNLRHSELRNVDSSYIWYPYQDTDNEYDIRQSEINIEYNKFIDSSGFAIGHDDRNESEIRVNIRHNVFSGWREAAGGGLINNWASYGSSQTVVEYNSFLKMTDKVALKLRSGYDSADMTATNNYWGTTDIGTIEEMIYDENDDINAASEIEFTPILEEPHPDTPTL
jgi:hypothetical protein